jgi:hypothetical protein
MSSKKRTSSEKIDYSLRPAKNVERKLIVQLLQEMTAQSLIRISDYPYIGFGSLWFVDFILFHKSLGIQRMISIEGKLPGRARFNAPFSCVEIIEGQTSQIFTEFPTWIEGRPALIWLDYDGKFSANILADIRTVCRSAADQTIFFLSVNVNFPSEQSVSKEFKDSPTDPRLAELKHIARDFLSDVDDFSAESYPQIIRTIIRNAFQSYLFDLGRDQLTAIELPSFQYQDGAKMLTVGFVIGEESKWREGIKKVATALVWWKHPEMVDIQLPLLTPKEKSYLDAFMPVPDEDPAPRLKKASEATFLAIDDLESYRTYYRYYPIFGEYSW